MCPTGTNSSTSGAISAPRSSYNSPSALVLEDLGLPTDIWEVHVPGAEPGQIATYRAGVPP